MSSQSESAGGISARNHGEGDPVRGSQSSGSCRSADRDEGPGQQHSSVLGTHRVTQRARDLLADLGEHAHRFHLLIRDRDAKYSAAFDAVFAADGIRVIRTPVRAPKANAYAERWIRTLRAECLDWLLIRNQAHLEHVLAVYVEPYNRARPHRSLYAPVPTPPPASADAAQDIERIDRLGGLLHEYQHAA